MPMMQTLSIDWDAPKSAELPQNVEIEADNEDDLVEKLSDNYGWCVNSVSFRYMPEEIVDE